jgi:CD36 family
MNQYGDHIALFQDMPRIFLPVFWVEQRFVMAEKESSQIRFALLAPVIGQVVGVSLLVLGFVIIFFHHFKRLFCTNHSNLLLIVETTGKDSVIKDYEMNPLVNKNCANKNVV